MQKKVLILGGSSNIGIELAKIFIKKKLYKINLHYNSNSKNFVSFKSKCNFIKADLSNSNYKGIDLSIYGITVNGIEKIIDDKN